MAVIGGSINRLTGRPRLPVFGGGLAKTYADFQAHLATFATQTTDDVTVGSVSAGPKRFIYTGSNDGLFGTSWGPTDGNHGWAGPFGGGFAHGVTSQAIRLGQVGREVMLRSAFIDNRPSFDSYTRNGVTSSDLASPANAYGADEILYFVDGVGAFRVVSTAGTGPVPYNF